MRHAERRQWNDAWNAARCALLFLIAATPLAAQMQQLPLDHGWRFRAVSSLGHPEARGWHPATVPGVVQTDLRKAGVIPDPFFGDNEKQLQWIGLTDWEYVDDFEVSAALLRYPHLEMVFDGLDTFADVSLNNVPLLSGDNQFRVWRADVKPRLHQGLNTLHILFHSPTNLLTPIVAKLPVLIPGTGYEYAPEPIGIQGNEDVGQMSAWFVMSALDFYPVDPVSGNYILGSPLFDRAVVALGNGRQIESDVRRADPSHAYIHSFSLNGKPQSKAWFHHSEISQGGTLSFQMGPEPDTNFGAASAVAPPSLTL